MKVLDLFRDVKRFFRNVWVFRRTLRGHRNWDYSSYYLFLKDFTDDLQRLKHPMNEHLWDSRMKKARIIGNLANRLLEDGYLIYKFKYEIEFGEMDETGRGALCIHTTPLHDFPVDTKHMHKMKLEEQDFEMMHNLIKKHLRTFWD